MNVYICDIDGTIAENSHREHLAKAKKWDEFFDLCHLDKPVEHMRRLLDDLTGRDGRDEPIAQVVYVTGRPERVRGKTVMWMQDHGFPIGPVYMRPNGDHRPDHVMKVELLEDVRLEFGEPTMAFDDRNSVVEMWRAHGVPCCQVTDKGDF